MKKNKVSIVVPVYNVEEYIDDCISSILRQTYTNIEVILVDDGSPDNCGKICDHYSEKDSRIVVIHKKNGGLSSARNAGISAATGNFITFIDSDDSVSDDYVEYLLNLCLKYETDISVCAYQLVKNNKIIRTQENGTECKMDCSNYLEKMLYQENTDVSACAKLFRTDLFSDIRFPEGKIFEDTFTTHQLILKVPQIALGLKAKYNYMMRDNSIMTSAFSEKKLILIEATSYMTSNITEKYPSLSDAALRSNIYARLSIMRQLVFAKPRKKDLEQEFRKYVLSKKKNILKNRRVPKRDKLAIISLVFGCWAFKLSWFLYCKFTGRM